jgi:hypothetical protein
VEVQLHTNKLLGGGPAGTPTDADGQQPGGVLVTSERDQRVLDWLVSQVGVAAVETACTLIPGSRRAYVSNLAKVLGLSPPSDLALSPPDVTRQHLANFRRLLQRKGR